MIFVWSGRVVTLLRTHWFDLLAVHGIRSILLQHQSSNASILFKSSLRVIQVSAPYRTMGNTSACTNRVFVCTEMPLSFQILPSLNIANLPMARRLLISSSCWPEDSILAPRKVKLLTTSMVSPCSSKLFKHPVDIILVFFRLRKSPAASLAVFIKLRPLDSSIFEDAKTVVSSAYRRFVITLPPKLIPPCHSSKVFLIMRSA